MNEETLITIPQEADEAKLTGVLTSGEGGFSLSVHSSDPKVPPLIPLRISSTTSEGARTETEKLLYLVRAMFRSAAGKTPDLPPHLKEMEAKMPAFKFLIPTDYE